MYIYIYINKYINIFWGVLSNIDNISQYILPTTAIKIQVSTAITSH